MKELELQFFLKTHVEIYFSMQQACVAMQHNEALDTLEKSMSTLKWEAFERQD
jgi:hypothetical protein